MLFVLAGCTGTMRVGARTTWLGGDKVALHGVLAFGIGLPVDGDERAIVAVADPGFGGHVDGRDGHFENQFGVDYLDFAFVDRNDGISYRLGLRFGIASDFEDFGTLGDEDVDSAAETITLSLPVAVMWTYKRRSGGRADGKSSLGLKPDKSYSSVALELSPVWLVHKRAYDSPAGLQVGLYWELVTIDK